MSYSTERAAIAGLFYDALGSEITLITASDIAWEGHKFELPSSGLFVWFQIMNAGANQQSMGGVTNLHRYTGTVQIDLYNREGEGTSQLRALADEIDPVFRQKQISCSDGDTIKFFDVQMIQSSYSSQKSSGRKDSVNRFVLRIPYYRNRYL